MLCSKLSTTCSLEGSGVTCPVTIEGREETLDAEAEVGVAAAGSSKDSKTSCVSFNLQISSAWKAKQNVKTTTFS